MTDPTLDVYTFASHFAPLPVPLSLSNLGSFATAAVGNG